MAARTEERERPQVFVGSSTEGEAIARALQLELDQNADVTLWSQGVFGLSGGTLETLVEVAADFDFAILVLTPDDVSEKRGTRANAPRDNVLFELGLFMGALGRSRTFVVRCSDDDLELPSDLAGVAFATFRKRPSGPIRAAVGTAATKVLEAIEKAPRKAPAARSVGGGLPGSQRLDPDIESALAALSSQKQPRNPEWVAIRLKVPAIAAEHFIDLLAATSLVEQPNAAKAEWQVSKAGREYVYRWSVPVVLQERPTRREPPSEFEVSIASKGAHKGLGARLVNASLDGSGLGLVCAKTFKTDSPVVVRLRGADRRRNFEARVVHSFPFDQGGTYLGLHIPNPVARQRIATMLNIVRWVPSTMQPPSS